jgi:hypothetical protein
MFFYCFITKMDYDLIMEKQKETYSVRLNPSLVKEVKLLCVHQDKYFSDIIEEGLRDILKKYEAQKQPHERKTK